MKTKFSFRRRIFLAFACFSIVTAILYGIIIHTSVLEGEDIIFENRLKIELNAYFKRFEENPHALPPQSEFLKGYIGTGDMPQHLRDLLQGLDEGYYETWAPFGLGGEGNYHIAVKKLPHDNRVLYLVYDIEKLEISSYYRKRLTLVLIAGLIFVILLGTGISHVVAKRITAPLQSLVASFRSADPSNLPRHLPGQFKDMEMAALAAALERSMNRISAFVEREKQFSRDAGHELRTPVTVIKGAAELLRSHHPAKNDGAGKALARIERAVGDMEKLIESLLWLARAEAVDDPGTDCDLEGLVREVVQHRQAYAESKHLVLQKITVSPARLIAPEPIVRIIIDNIVYNAIHFTTSGTVSVTVQTDRVVIADTGPGMTRHDLDTITQAFRKGAHSTGFGLGLSIVQRLCKRFGWQLAIESREGKGTTASWIFQPRQDDTRPAINKVKGG